MPVEIKPICACCREKIHTEWRAWRPVGALTCAKPTCVGWAESRTWSLYSRGLVGIRKGPVRPAGPPRCDSCRKPRPKLRDCFVLGNGIYCSLTCQQRAAARA